MSLVKRRFVLIPLFLILTAASSRASIINGTFDTDISGWTITGTNTRWENLGSDPGVLWLNDFPWVVPTAEATVSGLTVGSTYDLTFDLWQGVVSGTGPNFRAEVLDGLTALVSFTTDTDSLINEPGNPQLLSFNATNSDLTIRFTSQLNADVDYYVDNVAVVPESSGLLLSFVFAGLCLFRRRSRS